MALIALAAIVGLSLGVQLLTRRDFPLCLFATVAGVADLLYVAGLFGVLAVAGPLLLYGGILALAASVGCMVLKARLRSQGRLLMAPAAVIFLASTIMYWFTSEGLAFHLFDEFHHWGIIAKDVVLFRALPDASSVNEYQNYPPGAALFYYFFLQGGVFDERTVYFSSFVLLCAPLTVFLRNLQWRQVHWIVLTVATILLLLIVPGDALTSIYVDPILGAYAAALLYVYFTEPEAFRCLLFLVPGLFLLPLIKIPGFHFAILVLIAVVVDAVVCAAWQCGGLLALGRLVSRVCRETVLRPGVIVAAILYAPALSLFLYVGERLFAFLSFIACSAGVLMLRRKQVMPYLRMLSAKGRLIATIAGLVVLATPFVSHYSWQRWVVSQKIRISNEPRYSLSDAVNAFIISPRPIARDLMRDFPAGLCGGYVGTYCGVPLLARIWDRIASSRNVPRLSFPMLGIFLLCLFAAAAAAATSPIRRRRLVALTGVLFVGGAAFLVMLMFHYYYGFETEVREGLGGLDRYVWSFALVPALVGWSLAAHEGRACVSRKLGTAALLACALVTLSLYLLENWSWAIIPPRSTVVVPAIRGKIRAELELIKAETGNKGSVYVVYRPGYASYLLLQYELAPCACNSNYFDESPPQGAGAGPSKAADAWAQALSRYRYSYVWVLDPPDGFYVTYNKLFDGGREPGDFFYRVVSTGQGLVRLTPVRRETR